MAQVRVNILTDIVTAHGKFYAGDTIWVDEDLAADLVGISAGEVTPEPESQEMGIPVSFTFAPAAGGANVSEVEIQCVDAAGNPLQNVFQFDIWLTGNANGLGHHGSAASGTVQAKADSGLVVDTHVAKKAFKVQTLADGTFTLEITDSGKTGYRVAAQVPGTGKTVVSDALVSGDYGS